MINIKDCRVQIQGSSEELFKDLIALHVTMFNDPEFTELGRAAVIKAAEIARENDFDITDIKKATFHGNDRRDELNDQS